MTTDGPSGDVLLETGTVRRTPVQIPVYRYTSPEFFAREMELLWPRTWQLACTVDHVAEPGDWYEYRVGPISVLVVRGDDGVLRAFQNVCLHRGSELCSGSGTDLAEIRCPFHRWTWGLDGRLREVPSRREFGVLNDDYPLIGVQVDTWGPMVFVNLDPRRRAAGRVPGTGTGRDRVGEPRRVPRPGVALDAGGVQLEDPHRGLQRDLPRAGHPPGDARDGRRRQRSPGDLAAPRAAGAVLRAPVATPGPCRATTRRCSRRSWR